MGFFINSILESERRRLELLREIEVDGQDQSQDDDDAPADYTGNDGDQQEDNNPPPEEDQGGNEPPPDEGQGEEPPPDQGGAPPPLGGDPGAAPDQGGDEEGQETTDYTQDSYDGEEGGEGDQGGGEEPPDEPVDDIKEKEEELYASLSPEQLDIKHHELKNQFLALFDLTTSIADRVGDMSIDEEDFPAMEYVSTKLNSLKEMLVDYMDKVYKTKSFIENSVNYNRFLAVLNGINKILEEIGKKDKE